MYRNSLNAALHMYRYSLCTPYVPVQPTCCTLNVPVQPKCCTPYVPLQPKCCTAARFWCCTKMGQSTLTDPLMLGKYYVSCCSISLIFIPRGNTLMSDLKIPDKVVSCPSWVKTNCLNLALGTSNARVAQTVCNCNNALYEAVVGMTNHSVFFNPYFPQRYFVCQCGSLIFAHSNSMLNQNFLMIVFHPIYSCRKFHNRNDDVIPPRSFYSLTLTALHSC